VKAFILFLSLSFTVIADEIRGKVVSIADGDTITVLDQNKVQHKIRLEGIDAPEKGQAFGAKSKEMLGALVGEKEVIVTWSKKDRYGRILGDVQIGETLVNLALVTEGMAWHYKQFSDSQSLSDAEDAARKSRKGLWTDDAPIPPWEYRKRKREKLM